MKNHDILLNLGCGSHYHKDWVNVDIRSSSPDVLSHDLTQKLPFEDNSVNVVYHSHLLEHFPKCNAANFLSECYRLLKPGGILRVVVPDLEMIVRLYLELLGRSLDGVQKAKERYEWIMLEMFDQMVRNQSGGEMLKYWQQNPMPAEDFVIERVGDEVRSVLATIRSTPDRVGNRYPESSVQAPGVEDIGRFRLSGEIHQWMYDRYSLSQLLQATGFINIAQCASNESAITNFNSYHLDVNADGRVRKPDSLFMEAVKPDRS